MTRWTGWPGVEGTGGYFQDWGLGDALLAPSMAPRIAIRALHAQSRWRFVVCDVSYNVYVGEVWLFSFLSSSLTYLCGTQCRAEVRRPSMDMKSR